MIQQNAVDKNAIREIGTENLGNEVGTRPPSIASVENMSSREYVGTSPKTAALSNDAGSSKNLSCQD